MYHGADGARRIGVACNCLAAPLGKVLGTPRPGTTGSASQAFVRAETGRETDLRSGVDVSDTAEEPAAASTFP